MLAWLESNANCINENGRGMLKFSLKICFLLAGVTCQAQSLNFGGSVSVELIQANFKPATAYKIAGQTQFQLGSFELQTDVAYTTFSDAPLFSTPNSPIVSMDWYSTTLHASYGLPNGLRLGAFTTANFNPQYVGAEMFMLGAEVMLSFRKTDIEAACGFNVEPNSTLNGDLTYLSVAAYHAFTPEFEASFEAESWVNSSSPDSRITLASLNGKYTFANLPLALKLGVYNAYFTWRSPLSSFRATLSYEFGASPQNRAFHHRGFDAAALTVVARS